MGVMPSSTGAGPAAAGVMGREWDVKGFVEGREGHGFALPCPFFSGEENTKHRLAQGLGASSIACPSSYRVV